MHVKSHNSTIFSRYCGEDPITALARGNNFSPPANFSFCYHYSLESTMSFNVPRPPRARSQPSSLSRKPSTSFSLNSSLRDHHLTPPSDVPKTRRGYGTRGRVRYRDNEVLAEPLGRIFVQLQPAHSRTSTSTAIPFPESIPDDPFVDAGDVEPPPLYVLGGGEDPELQ